jgi:hypothetical protein
MQSVSTAPAARFRVFTRKISLNTGANPVAVTLLTQTPFRVLLPTLHRSRMPSSDNSSDEDEGEWLEPGPERFRLNGPDVTHKLPPSTTQESNAPATFDQRI